MIEALLVLLAFQLAGEAITHASALPLPGPVLGLVLFAFALKMMPGLAEKVSGVAHGILRNLSLLFVPAGVGVVQHADLVIHQWLPILGALVISTALTLAVTALTFVGVRKLMGGQGAQNEGPTS
ncbi:MAG: CidA/LrgA family protein [Rhodobiaceae bacterium]|nr:CidA/LrgA family protein [Rhodobiaceae bacterium]MCC0018205.1 CidA/LrgA family protein [Rhodobiaceae bacterium]MCC0050801.1 CidA/LrgA family protein [Rhodobiaceae bacterium]MCC0060554.1 CidA/LrgA family protein [Rhodobiaceae bacterium]